MWAAISKFFSKWGLRIVIVVGLMLAGYITYLKVNLELTQSALKSSEANLKAAEQTIAAQQRAIEAVDRVEDLSDHLDQIVTISTRRISQAEGSTDEVPTDVATAWAASIDELRLSPTPD